MLYFHAILLSHGLFPACVSLLSQSGTGSFSFQGHRDIRMPDLYNFDKKGGLHRTMQTIAKWDIWELELPAAETFDNPFLDVELQAVLTCGDRSIVIDGFYDGTSEDGNTHIFRLRFSPMEEGEWHYKTSSDCAALNGLEGDFCCGPAASRGGLTIDKTACHWFGREDGGHQFLVNDGWFPHAANGHWISYEDVDYPQPSETDMKEFIDVLSAHGVNLIVDMSQLYARQASITDPSFAWPWKVVDPDTNRIDCDRFNLDFYRRFERTLSYCAEKDLFFAVELLFDNSTVRPLEWAHHPLNKANGGWLDTGSRLGWGPVFDLTNETHKTYTARYLRYTLARLAPYRSILWEIGGENANLSQLPDWMLPGCGVPNETVASWYNYWGTFIKEHDPYKRLCTYGDTTYQSLMVTGPGNDWVLTQDPRNYPREDVRDYYRAMNQDGIWYWQFNRPMVIGEMNSFNNGIYGRERRMYWTAAASGFHMGRSDRHFGLIEDHQLVESKKFPQHADGKSIFEKPGLPPIYPWLAILRHFMEEHVSYWNMAPDPACVHSRAGEPGSYESWCRPQADADPFHPAAEPNPAFCLSDPGEEYLVYMPFGGGASLTIPESGNYKACLLNPITGERTQSVVSASLSETTPCPYSSAAGGSPTSGIHDSIAGSNGSTAGSGESDSCFRLFLQTPDANDWVWHLKRIHNNEEVAK